MRDTGAAGGSGAGADLSRSHRTREERHCDAGKINGAANDGQRRTQ